MNHNTKLRLTAVSYLNTKPFIYGLLRSDFANDISLSLDIPSVCAQKLLNGEADIALTPVAIIPELGQSWLISEYCIGAIGPVRSVCLFANQPVENLEQIYLDFHSRTSVALVQVLCKYYWKVKPEFIPASEGFEQKIGGKIGAVVIGDRAFGLEKKFSFVYDLGEAWTNWTGLPFVFAAWISRKPIEESVLQQFNAALASGLDRLPELMQILPAMPGVDLEHYFRNNISYQLDDAKWAGLNKFLSLLDGENTYQLNRLAVGVAR